MIEETIFINHWLRSGQLYFPAQYGIDSSYFIALNNLYKWIEQYIKDTGMLPTLTLAASEFDDFIILEELDSIDYTVNALRQQKAFMEYRPLLIDSAKKLDEGGNTIEIMYQMQKGLERILSNFSGKMTHHDWVKHALERYKKYMEKHGDSGLAGLSTGLASLDKLTGGWRANDLILIVGRLGGGKSYLSQFLAYCVWEKAMVAEIENPVLFITTEMSELEVAYRLDTIRRHFSNRALNEGRLPDPELYKEYLEELTTKKNSFLILSQESNGGKKFTPADIQALIEVHKPIFVVIDQLYDLSDGTREWDIRRRIVNVSSALREITLHCQTPILLVSQASREAAKAARNDPKATPELDHVQESDNPAQKATRVLALRKINDIFKITLRKNRGGPENVDIFLRSSLDDGYFEEIEEEQAVF